MIHVERYDGLLILQLCRPDRGNALDESTVSALQRAIDEAMNEPKIHSLLIHSSSQHFCTGFDLSNIETLSDDILVARLVAIEKLLQTLWYAPLRSLALCEGRAWGAGADLLAVCDQPWLGPQASIRFPGVSFGLILGTRRLGSIIGSARAMQWLSEGFIVDQAQAVSSGLAQAAYEEDMFRTLVEKFRTPPTADRSTMLRLRQQLRPDHRQADMQALIDSANDGSLLQRIAAYRQSSLANRPGSK